MMKSTLKLFCLLISCLQLTLASGQNLKKDLDIQLSEPFKIEKKAVHLAMVALDGGEFVALESKPRSFDKGFDLVRFNEKLKEVKRNSIDLRSGDEDHFLEKIFYYNGRLVILTSAYIKDEEIRSLFLQELDPQNLQKVGNRQLISSLNTVKGRTSSSSYFSFAFSSDDSKILILQKDETKKKEKSNYKFSVLDCNQDFNLVWSKQFQSETEDKLEDIEKMSISNSGKVYLLFIKFNEVRKTKKDGEANYAYELREYEENTEKPSKHPIKLKGDFITDIQIGINQNNDVVCTGFYSSVGTLSIKGCFYLLFDSEKKSIVKESKNEFSLDFLTANLNERKTKKAIKKKEKGKDIELQNFELGDIVLQDDGGVIQVAECYYIITYTYTDANGYTQTRTTYHYDDIIISSISPEGDFNWVRKIRKRQASGSPSPEASYKLSIINNKLYFFHNGNSENLLLGEKENPKSWTMGKKGTSIITEINSEGYMRKDIFSDVPAHRMIPVIQRGIKLDNNQVLFFGEYKRDSRYIKIKIATD